MVQTDPAKPKPLACFEIAPPVGYTALEYCRRINEQGVANPDVLRCVRTVRAHVPYAYQRFIEFDVLHSTIGNKVLISVYGVLADVGD